MDRPKPAPPPTALAPARERALSTGKSVQNMRLASGGMPVPVSETTIAYIADCRSRAILTTHQAECV